MPFQGKDVEIAAAIVKGSYSWSVSKRLTIPKAL